MTLRLAAVSFVLAACPAATVPTRGSVAGAPRVERTLVLCEGHASRADGVVVTLRRSGEVRRGELVVARVAPSSIRDGDGRVLASLDEDGALRVLATNVRLTLAGDEVLRDDGRRVSRRAGDDAVQLQSARGELARSPWTLRCEGPAATAMAVLLLLPNGPDHAEATASQGERVR